MTALLDLHPDTGHPVLAGLAVLEDALDVVLDAAATPLASGEYAGAVRSIERISRRMDAARLKLVAAADRAGAAQDAGYAGTEAWVARTTNTSTSSATQEVGLARDLEAGHDATATALSQGLVSPDHAAVIVAAARRLPDGVTREQRRVVEESLVAKAQRYAPDQLRRIARRAIEAIQPDEQVVDAHENEHLRTEEEAARDRTRLTFHDNDDGTVTGHFNVPALAAAFLRKVIESMTAPRRMGASTGSTDDTTRAARFYDWDHRRGLAFVQLLEHLPTDHLHHKTAATVVVTIEHSILQDTLKSARLDTGHTLSAGEARRLACTAGLIPTVLGGASVALDLGRETRLFSPAQRLAAGLRHDTCAADGCERPYAWCELHHRQPWSRGGRTDLDNAVPLCSYHHQRIHDHAFKHRCLPDGTIRLSRRT